MAVVLGLRSRVLQIGRDGLLLGMTLLSPGQGGIARVARMTARALIEDGHRATLLSFMDKEPISIAGVPARRAGSEPARVRSALSAGGAARFSCDLRLGGDGESPSAYWRIEGALHDLDLWDRSLGCTP